MRLTLGKAKELLADHSPADKLEDRIVRSIERILVSGKFNGGMARLALLCEYGDITLPRNYRTVEGVKVDRDSNGNYAVRQLTNGWYEFLPGKYSLADTASGGYCMDTVRSLGDGHATMHDLPFEGTLKKTVPGFSTPALPVTIYGRDENGMPTTLVLDDYAEHANPFTKIERIHKEQSTLSVQIVHTDDDANETTMAWMEPTEEETFYRRYREDSLLSIATANVIALVKVRFIAPTSDDDVLPITNITALGFEMDSLNYLAENDVSLSREYHAEAINLLNDELFDSHSVDEIPALRFHYPGGTPRLTSHY